MKMPQVYPFFRWHKTKQNKTTTIGGAIHIEWRAREVVINTSYNYENSCRNKKHNMISSSFLF